MLEAETLKVDGIQDTEDLDLVDNMSRMSIGVPITEKPGVTDSNPIFKDTWLSSKVYKLSINFMVLYNLKLKLKIINTNMYEFCYIKLIEIIILNSLML